jgi:hypothetical protein
MGREEGILWIIVGPVEVIYSAGDGAGERKL